MNENIENFLSEEEIRKKRLTLYSDKVQKKVLCKST